MTEATAASADGSAIDDVRRIREQFSHDSGGDIRRHAEQTQAAFRELQTQLNLPTVAPPAAVSANQ
jgi:hypothetical protein